MQHNSEHMKSIPVAAAEIEYSERGEGEPLLLVHAGVFADWFAPMTRSDALHGFRVIRVRRAGYGPNAPKGPTLQDHANHLWTLSRVLHLATVHVVGHLKLNADERKAANRVFADDVIRESHVLCLFAARDRQCGGGTYEKSISAGNTELEHTGQCSRPEIWGS